MLQLKVLGTLSLQAEPDPLPPEARQKRRIALLALLAVADTQGISRDKLQSYLWPESPSDRARHALDQLIYASRHSLGADLILAEAGDLKLDYNVITTDLRQFDDAIAGCRLADAVSLYGGPLLDGFHLCDSRELESWIDSARSRIQSRYHFALESLAKDAAARGEHARAAEWWCKLATSDPLSSRIAAETTRVFIRGGDNPSAIRHARNYQKLIRKELEVEPDPLIESLISALPRPQPAVAKTPEKARSPGMAHHHPQQETIPVDANSAITESRIDRRFNRGAIVGAVFAILIVAGSIGFFRRAEEAHPSQANAIVNPEARALYLRGVNAWNDRSKSSLDTAVIYFRKAIESEPDFAEAHAGLANAYAMIGYSGYRSANPMFPNAKAAALRAIELDSTIAAPYAALGMELTWERKFAEAQIAYRKAISLNPRYATAHQWYGILLMILGDTKGAVAETGRAAELDPLSPQIQNNYGAFLSASGQKEAALHQFQKVMRDEPDSAWVQRNPWLLTNAASVYAANGQFDKAIQFAQKAVDIVPGHPRATMALASVLFRMGRKEDARAAFAQSDTTNEQYSAYRALVYVAEAQPDSAFVWFDRVNDWGIPILISLGGLRHSPVVADDPRLRILFARLGLPLK